MEQITQKMPTASLQKPLPVVACRESFLQVLKENPVVILTGDAGSGKTTQIPKYVLQTLLEDPECKGRIACTQPRRLAAKSVAERVAYEMRVEIGEQVGYNIRFENNTCKETRLVYMTDGILYAQMMQDNALSEYKCIIVDEAHERSINTDLIMANLREIVLHERRYDLKVIIMSATLNAGIFQTYFGGAPLFHIPGRIYPVNIMYTDNPAPSQVFSILAIVEHIHTKMDKGDILVFMPGENEVRSLCSDIAKYIGESISPRPLYSSLQAGEQSQALESPALGIRKCIVATNIAETSLTIDGIVYVIDSGVAKQSQWNARIRIGRLGLVPISKASANQRTNRAGRTQPGYCFRIYTKERFDALPSSNTPGIQCADFAPAMLRTMATGRWETFAQINLISLPHIDFLARAMSDLSDLGYMTQDGKITKSGIQAAKIPVDPKWVFAIEAAKDFGMHQHVIGLAAIASVQDSMFWESYQHREVLPTVYRQWAHPHSDHIAQLNVLYAYIEACGAKNIDIREWCKVHLLNINTMIKIREIRKQLFERIGSLKPQEWLVGPKFDTETAVNIRKALARGLFFNTAVRIRPKQETFKTVHENQEVLVHPASSVERGMFDWVVYSNANIRAKPYMETVTGIDPKWIMDLAHFQQERMPKNMFGKPRQMLIHRALEALRNT